jgi:hypothetical protein
LQRPCLRFHGENLSQARSRTHGKAPSGAGLNDATPPLAINAMVARFVDRLAALSASEWESIQQAITKAGVVIDMLEASRNAAVALAVRDLISRDQFDNLYAPFLLAIPLESLEAPPELD